jgi:hypothetical protein
MHARMHQTPSGVFVHWGAYESGKSAAARIAAQRVRDERRVYLFHGFDIASGESVGDWLRTRLSLHPKDGFDAAFPRTPGTIIIDHADTLFRIFDFLPTLRALAHDSHKSQHFNVLVILSSYERAREIVRGGVKGAEMLGPSDSGRWTREQLLPIWDAAVDNRPDDAVFETAVIAGTPAFLLLAIKRELWSSPERALALDYEWQNAKLALDSDGEFKPGRFPDRDAVFHFHPGMLSVALAMARE